MLLPLQIFNGGEEMKTKKALQRYGTYPVYLTGSRRTIHRVVYRHCGKDVVIFGGDYITVEFNVDHFYTVEPY